MSSNNRDISVSTTRNSDGQLISSQSIDGIKYYTYRFHLFILSESTRNFINQLRVNGSYLLKDWIYFVKMNVLQAPSAGDINGIVTGSNSNLRWESGNGTGKDLFEIVTTSRIDLFEIKVTYPQWHAGWCIYEDDVLVFKDVVNGGTGNSPSNAYYYYPLNNGNLPHKLRPIENRVGQGWRLITQLPPNSERWFPGDINFTDVNDDEELLFTRGDCVYWYITTRYNVCGTFTGSGGKVVTAIDSNFGQTNILIYYRTGIVRDPTIILRNQSNQNVWRMYTEDLNNQYDVNHIHSSGMYVYARPMKFTFDQLDPIVSQIGSGWKLIRHVMGSNDQWFAGDTNFSEVHNDDELLFTRGDCVYWCITTRYNVCGTFTGSGGKVVTAIDSNFGQTNILIYYRTGVVMDPTIILRNQSNQNVWRMYTEDLNNQHDVDDIHSSGMYVYTRPRQIVRYPSRYKQITTSYDGVTGQVSSSSESYINALTSSYTIDGNGSTVENMSNHKNELINIITTTIPDPENIITIINEDKRTNIITTTKKENDAIKAVEDTIKKIIIENPQNSLGVQITIESNFETDLKSTITTNHIDTSEFATRTFVTFLLNGDFDSWIEVSEAQIIDASTTEVTTTHKNEDGSTQHTVTLTTTGTQFIRVTENFTDKSEFETQTYITLLNGDFVSWTEVSETQTIDATTTEVTTTHKNENGITQHTVTLTTTDTELIRVTENFTDKSAFETQTYTTLLNGDFVSWIEKIESYLNLEGNLEFVRNIKDASGTTNVNVQIVTTIMDVVNNTKTVQTVNTIDKSDFETRRIVTDSSNNDAFISWSEESETIVNGNVEEVTTVEKDENGNFLQSKLTTTITNGDGSKTITENFTNLSSVTTEKDSSGAVKYVINNNRTDIVFSDGSYPVLNINDQNFTYSQPFQPYNDNIVIHTQKYEPTNSGFIEDRLKITFKNDSSKHLTCFRNQKSIIATSDLSGYQQMRSGNTDYDLIRSYITLKNAEYRWFASFIYRPTSFPSVYHRLIHIRWNKLWPGSGASGENRSTYVYGRSDGRIEIRWYQNKSETDFFNKIYGDLSTIKLNQDCVITIEVDNNYSNKSRWRTYINGTNAGYYDVQHYNATDSGSNMVYPEEIRHAYASTGFEMKDILWGRYTNDTTVDQNVRDYIRTLTERRNDLILQDVDIYQEYISS